MSLIKVSTYRQPPQRYSFSKQSELKDVLLSGRVSLNIQCSTGIDTYSGIHRYILDNGNCWMPAKECVIIQKYSTLFKRGLAEYYVDTISAGHPNRLRGYNKNIGQLFI